MGVRKYDQGKLMPGILDRIAKGESLRAICQDKGMPSAPTVHLWVSQNAELAEQYTRAREKQAHALADEILEIADSSQGMGSEGVNAARLRVDSRKWYLSKVLPKVYGDRARLDHEVSGPDKGPIVLDFGKMLPTGGEDGDD